MSKLSKKTREKRYIGFEDQQLYLSRITKTLYYGRLPKNETLSLPVTELAAEIFSEVQHGKTLQRLHINDAAKISRNACVSPCSLVLALLYLERLKVCNPEYIDRTVPSDLFLVSLLVSSKFLFDDGETDEVFMDEWASSGGMTVQELVKLEKAFLQAINWEIYVNELTFWKKLHEIEVSIARREGLQRGYFTYTDLQSLLEIVPLQRIINYFTAVSMVLIGIYATALLTLVFSFYITSQIPGTALHPKSVVYLPLEKTNDFAEHNKTYNTKTDYLPKCCSKAVDVVNVFKTGFILASIKSVVNPYDRSNSSNIDENSQATSWDWWNNSTMLWLSKTSEFIENFNAVKFIDFSFFAKFLDAHNARVRGLELTEHINKATQTRIQDQMEQSWHVEWTDSLKKRIHFDGSLWDKI